jgi:hypothetical protein
MKTQKFWVVMNDGRGLALYPMRHLSEASAFTEAERLTRQNGGKFFVLEAKGACAKVDVQTARFTDDDGIPF